MVRKKVTSRQTKDAKKKGFSTYFHDPSDIRIFPDKNNIKDQVHLFAQKVLKPAYDEFVETLDNEADEDDQRIIIADYARVAGAEHLGSMDTQNKIMNTYLDQTGKVKWDQFKADVRSKRHLFDPDDLTTSMPTNSVGAIPGKTKMDRALRRLVLRQTGYAVVDKGIPIKYRSESGRPMLGVRGDASGKNVYRTLVGPESISVGATDIKVADSFMNSQMNRILQKSNGGLTGSSQRWLKKMYPGKNLSEAYAEARRDEETFKRKMLNYRSVEGARFDLRKLYHDVTGLPYTPPVGQDDHGPMPSDYDKGLALDFNKALGLGPGSINPMAVAAAMKWGKMKTQEGLSNEDIISAAVGKELEASYIHRAVEKTKKKTIRPNALKKRAMKMGWELTGLDDTSFTKTPKKKKGFKSKYTTTSGTSSYASGKSTSAPTSKSLFTSKQVKISPSGQFVWKKTGGAISTFGKKTKSKVEKVIKPKKKDRERSFLKEFGETYPSDYLEDAKRKMKEGNWLQRRLLEHEAKRMTYDVEYRANKLAEKELDRGVATAKYAKAHKKAESIQKAAASPFYAAWYRFSFITKWIVVLAIAAAVLFIPIGMFYVLGWALAVGVIALIQFIVWVFMEIWLLMAQFIVFMVSLVGQGVSFIFNLLGRSFAGLTGGEYVESKYLSIQNMLMFERLDDGTFVVSLYADETGAKQLLTWGQLNLAPPSFLKLENFKPETFNSDTIIGYILPPVKDFFGWLYGPIADRYTLWMSNPETVWYWPGVVIGVPTILIIISIFFGYYYFKKKAREFV